MRVGVELTVIPLDGDDGVAGIFSVRDEHAALSLAQDYGDDLDRAGFRVIQTRCVPFTDDQFELIQNEVKKLLEKALEKAAEEKTTDE